jgi:hypothetical protein
VFCILISEFSPVHFLRVFLSFYFLKQKCPSTSNSNDRTMRGIVDPNSKFSHLTLFNANGNTMVELEF